MPASRLPVGWHWVTLGDVGTYINGRAFKPDEWASTGYPIVRIQNLTSRESGFNYYAGDLDGRHLVIPGDLLISWSASLDAFLWEGPRAALNQHIFKVLENPGVERRLLYYAVRNAMADIRAQVHGATMQHITKPEFLAIRVPLPPLPEQRRIAAILDEQMATVEKARKACEEQLEAARALPAAYLREVFEGEEARRWPILPLGEVGEIVTGVTLGRKLNGSQTRTISYLRVANVKDGALSLEDVYEIEATYEEVEKLRLQSGDLLLTEGRDPDKLGRGTYWQCEIPECIHQNHIFRVRLNDALVTPAFAAYQLGSSYGKRYFLAHAKQTTGIATINQQVLRRFPLRCPPLPEQATLTRILQRAQIIAEAGVQTALAVQRDSVAALSSALLRKAFSGEL